MESSDIRNKILIYPNCLNTKNSTSIKLEKPLNTEHHVTSKLSHWFLSTVVLVKCDLLKTHNKLVTICLSKRNSFLKPPAKKIIRARYSIINVRIV